MWKRPGAGGCSGRTPSRHPGSCLRAKGADAPPPHCGWGRVLPRRGPGGLLSPMLRGDRCRAATMPQPLPYSPGRHGGDRGLKERQDTQTGTDGRSKRQDSIIRPPWPG
uniref:Uncharacterized protein n=1 Tax=Accipiter nisus TaxID=211598 RepID=A0A8B9NJS7_9AVES